MKNVVPRVWENAGFTWSDIPGVGGNPVIVRIGYSEKGMGHGSVNLELHETFHAIDRYVLDNISENPEFRALFREEAAGLFAGNRYEELFPEEYFAEVACMIYLSETTRRTVREKLPQTYRWMTEQFDGFKPTAPAIAELERHWARVAVQRLSAMRVMSGFPDGTFRAGEQVTREQFVKLLIETVGLPVADGKASAALADVRPSSWSAPYIAAAVDAGVVVPTEFGGSVFRPGQVLTRIEMASWTARALGLQPNEQALAFTDNAAIRGNRGWIGAAAAAGIVTGTPGNRFAPAGKVTRAEAALVLNQVLDLPDSD